MNTGSRQLTENERLRISPRGTKLLILGFVAIGAIFCYLIFRHLEHLTASSSNNPYFLPGWLILFTLVIPYLYAWFIGLLAAYEMRLLSKHSRGLLYKQALDHLSRGLLVIVGSSIALQYLATVFPRNGNLSIGVLLVVIYALLAVIGAGYALLAYGANKLKRFEEV